MVRTRVARECGKCANVSFRESALPGNVISDLHLELRFHKRLPLCVVHALHFFKFEFKRLPVTALPPDARAELKHPGSLRAPSR